MKGGERGRTTKRERATRRDRAVRNGDYTGEGVETKECG